MPKPKQKASQKSSKPHASSNAGATIVNLPTELWVMIVNSSAFVDRLRLMLTCRDLYTLIHNDQRLLAGPRPPLSHLTAFFLQLEKEWVPNTLRYCVHCGKFRSTDEAYWQAMAEDKKHKIGGRINASWSSILNPCDYVISGWCSDSRLKKCPACAISTRKLNMKELKNPKSEV